MGRLLFEVVVLLAVLAVACVVVYRVASRREAAAPGQLLDSSSTWKAESRSEDGLTTVVAAVLVSRTGEIRERRQLAVLDHADPDYDAALDRALERASSTAFLLNSRREL